MNDNFLRDLQKVKEFLVFLEASAIGSVPLIEFIHTVNAALVMAQNRRSTFDALSEDGENKVKKALYICSSGLCDRACPYSTLKNTKLPLNERCCNAMQRDALTLLCKKGTEMGECQ
ncbi:MAG: hypothetical protein IJ234_07135 [Clostridia bacterium]|nr:hypothetical protein [Clostridia bacterium]